MVVAKFPDVFYFLGARPGQSHSRPTVSTDVVTPSASVTTTRMWVPRSGESVAMLTSAGGGTPSRRRLSTNRRFFRLCASAPYNLSIATSSLRRPCLAPAARLWVFAYNNSLWMEVEASAVVTDAARHEQPPPCC
jgi:hypothetical protein